jgi:two-component system response regulator MprA
MLTARDAIPDIVRGLDAGADDYVTKPFSFDELLARLGAVRRRVEICGSSCLELGDLVLDPMSRHVSRAGESIHLTRKEYKLLERLVHRAGKVVSRRSLIEEIWGDDHGVEDNTLEAIVHLLRSKIERKGSPRLLHTVRGVGYTLKLGGPA